MERKNYKEISILNCMLCLLVMFIHVSSMPISTASKDTFFYFLLLAATRSSAFVVQGFVFLSAFKLFCYPSNEKYSTFILKKIKLIYLPYLAWNCIYYAYFCKHGYYNFSWKDLFLHFFNGTLSAPFYFVVFIMQFYFLLPLWKWVYHKVPMVVMLLFSLLATFESSSFFQSIYVEIFAKEFLYFDRIFTTYLLYWTLGAYCGIHSEKVLKKLSEFAPILCLLYLFVMSLNVYSYYNYVVLGVISPYLEEILKLYCIVSIFFFLMLCQKIKFYKPIQILDKMTFPIYLSHCLFLYVVDDVMYRLDFGMIKTAYAFRLVALYSMTLILNYMYFAVKQFLKKKKKNPVVL